MGRLQRRTGRGWVGIGRAAVATAAIALASGLASRAAELVIPPPVQATMAIRILEYDRAFKAWAGGGATIGLVARSTPSIGELRQSLAGRDAQGVPIKVVEHAYRDPQELKAWIERSGVRLLYLGSDLSPETVASLTAGPWRKLPLLVTTRAQFDAGATLGMVVRDGKPHILVNLPASRAAGMDLDPKLLQLSEVIR